MARVAQDVRLTTLVLLRVFLRSKRRVCQVVVSVMAWLTEMPFFSPTRQYNRAGKERKGWVEKRTSTSSTDQ